MKLKSILPLLATSALFIPATHLLAQATGTSHPEQLNDNIDATDDSQQHYKKPSPAVPMSPSETAADAAVPSGATFTVVGPAKSTDGQPYTQQQSYTQQPGGTQATGDDHYAPHRSEPGFSPSSPAFNPNDVNSGVVTSVPTGPNDLPIGTRIVALLNNTISTKETPQGTRFAAELKQPVLRDGRIGRPAGSVIEGRRTQIHGGRRISGSSAIRLQADEITLPYGARYHLSAEVVDIDHFNASHVNQEGVITNKSNGAVTLGAAGLTTATGAVAGAMIGGGVGAVVGAGVGAGLGTYWWLRQDHQQTLPTGTELVFSLNDVLSVIPAQAKTTY
jgi:hypothetical protein